MSRLHNACSSLWLGFAWCVASASRNSHEVSWLAWPRLSVLYTEERAWIVKRHRCDAVGFVKRPGRTDLGAIQADGSNHRYTWLMPKCPVLNRNVAFFDRILALSISVAIHVMLFGWLFFVHPMLGGGDSGSLGKDVGSARISANFLARDEFRQRVERVTLPVESMAQAAVDVVSENALQEHSVDAIDEVEHAETGSSASAEESAVAGFEASEASPAEPVSSQNDGGTGDGGRDGLRTAYLAALRAAISEHWRRIGSKGNCRLILLQSPGGAVKNAVSTGCDLDVESRRALEAAALMAQPMPYIGYESVYQDSIEVEF